MGVNGSGASTGEGDGAGVGATYASNIALNGDAGSSTDAASVAAAETSAGFASGEAAAMQGPQLNQELMVLDERSRNIVQSRWLVMDADGNGTTTLHDLAAEYGISAERVRQIETAALKKMRGLLQTQAA